MKFTNLEVLTMFNFIERIFEGCKLILSKRYHYNKHMYYLLYIY
jgi:hypothetical protein